MLVSHDHRFIYIKSKKTASTSIQSYLKPYCKNGIIKSHNKAGHMTAGDVKKLVGDDTWNSYVKIIAVRNPWDKMVSVYFWRKNRKRPFYLRIWLFFRWGTFTNPAETHSFNDFVRKLKTKNAINVDRKIIFIGEDLPDYHFVRFEHLHEDMQTLCEKLDIPFDSTKIPEKKSGLREQRDYHQLYDDDVRELVRDEYRWEIDRFAYNFN